MDIAANPRAPEPLRLTRPVGGSGTQNAFVQNRMTRLQQGGATDLRINQQEVNINGARVGINRPDLQCTLSGRRFYEEFETGSLADANAHAPRILANDPLGLFVPWFVP